MVIRTLAMAVSSLVLAGCVSVGPNYKAPVQEPVVLQSAQQPVFSSVSPVASWWAQFDDPVLEQLVHGALSDNLDLRVAVARVTPFVHSRPAKTDTTRTATCDVLSETKSPAHRVVARAALPPPCPMPARGKDGHSWALSARNCQPGVKMRRRADEW